MFRTMKPASFDLVTNEPPARKKTRRDRIKERRAKRNRRRFYCYGPDGKERARKTETRSLPGSH